MARLRKLKIAFFLILSIQCSGCFTPMLWEATDPNKSIVAKSTKVSEDELKSHGVKYFKSEDCKTFYIEKGTREKFRDYAYRVLGTPITVALDAGSIAFILLGYAIGQDEVDKAIERGKAEDAAKYGKSTELRPYPRQTLEIE
ncbi:hypothetical protein KP003_10865 [Geomonas nitrogeniifigens]|uniref:hypothetical protein n=1 Tax=Geomonas diazotrophica TaxID=2843197 RepID=UPI001C2C3592|nr:hypothetical protein [Geomonas nitrogeniifigens]QXE84909.1 hypothetical protein KP003_10865 [Geomonas nitrogeniifigens]